MSDSENESELRHAIRDLKDEMGKYDIRFMRSDLLEIKLEGLKDAIKKLEEKLEEMAGERTWLIRIILGANVMAVIGLVLSQDGILK